MATLDTEKADRKVWVVRVPPFVAQQWHAAIARADQASVDEDAQPEVLGQVTITGGAATTLTVPGSGPGERRVLHMNLNRDAIHTSVMSFEAAAAAAAQTQATQKGSSSSAALQGPKVDGTVHKRYDAAPVRLSDATLEGGQAGHLPRLRMATTSQVTPDYLADSRKRMAAASRPEGARKVALISDVREARKLEGGTAHVSLYAQQREAKHAVKQQAGDARRRVRLSKDELESELFKRFADQPLWHVNELQKELDQPMAWLKEVVNDVAVQIKRGPNKDLWELKKHLRLSGSTPAPPRP